MMIEAKKRSDQVEELEKVVKEESQTRMTTPVCGLSAPWFLL